MRIVGWFGNVGLVFRLVGRAYLARMESLPYIDIAEFCHFLREWVSDGQRFHAIEIRTPVGDCPVTLDPSAVRNEQYVCGSYKTVCLSRSAPILMSLA